MSSQQQMNKTHYLIHALSEKANYWRQSLDDFKLKNFNYAFEKVFCLIFWRFKICQVHFEAFEGEKYYVTNLFQVIKKRNWNDKTLYLLITPFLGRLEYSWTAIFNFPII